MCLRIEDWFIRLIDRVDLVDCGVWLGWIRSETECFYDDECFRILLDFYWLDMGLIDLMEINDCFM